MVPLYRKYRKLNLSYTGSNEWWCWPRVLLVFVLGWTFWRWSQKRTFLNMKFMLIFPIHEVLDHYTFFFSRLDSVDHHKFPLHWHSWHVHSHCLVIAYVGKGDEAASGLRRKECCNDWLITSVCHGQGKGGLPSYVSHLVSKACCSWYFHSTIGPLWWVVNFLNSF